MQVHIWDFKSLAYIRDFIILGLGIPELFVGNDNSALQSSSSDKKWISIRISSTAYLYQRRELCQYFYSFFLYLLC